MSSFPLSMIVSHHTANAFLVEIYSAERDSMDDRIAVFIAFFD